MKYKFVSYKAVLFLATVFINYQAQIIHADELARFAAFNSDVSHLAIVSSSSFDRIEAMAYSPDGRSLVSSHSDSRITINKNDGDKDRGQRLILIRLVN